MRWTIAQVAGALDTRPGAGLDAVARLAGVSIDSRAIRPGELFIAIHGPRQDGHTFVAEVLEGGALAAVRARERRGRGRGRGRARCSGVAGRCGALKQPARQVSGAWG